MSEAEDTDPLASALVRRGDDTEPSDEKVRAENDRLRRELAEAHARHREYAERFRTVLEQSIDVAYRRNLQTDRYDYLSPSIQQLTGYTVQEFSDISSVALLSHIHPDDLPVVLARFDQFERSRRDGGQITDLFEYRLRRKDGEYRWIADSGVLVTDTEGTPLYHVGVARDVTEQKNHELALQRNNATLERAVAERTERLQHLAAELTLAEQRERRRLSDFLHDDLQQILFAAKLSAEQLADGAPDGETGGRASNIRSLLTEALAKTRSLGNELVPPLLYVIGLGPALRQLTEQMQERYGLRITFDADPLAHVPQDAARVQLYHSTRELLFNIVKHAGTDSAILRLSRTPAGVEISVSDCGSGFDAAFLRAGKTPAPGYGLFGIIERLGALGGSLSITSAVGSGTRATLFLPFDNHPYDPSSEESPGLTPASATSSPAATRVRVLVADDHDLVRAGVADLLATVPTFTVVGEATDGQHALELARELNPDVIVMDVRMPRMGGIEATRLIRNERPDVVVIGISAFGDEGFRREMLKAGAVDLLDKADSSVTLIPTIEKHVAARRNT